MILQHFSLLLFGLISFVFYQNVESLEFLEGMKKLSDLRKKFETINYQVRNGTTYKQIHVSDILEELSILESHLMYEFSSNDVAKKLNLTKDTGKKFLDLSRYISEINGYLEKYQDLFNTLDTSEDKVKFVSEIVKHGDNDFKKTLAQMEEIIAPIKDKEFKTGILFIIGKEINHINLKACSENDLPIQEIVSDLFLHILIVEFRSYAIAIEAFKFKEKNHKSEHDEKLNPEILIGMDRQSKSRCKRYKAAAKRAMKELIRANYRCTPTQYVKGENYLEFENLFRNILIQEADFSEDSCTKKCPEMSTKAHGRCYDWENRYCAHQCDGDLINCYDVHKPTVCQTEIKENYLWYEVEGTVYGSKNEGKCTANSLSGWTRGFVYCDYCLCECTLGQGALRAINTSPQTSDVDKNKIVTGARFTSHERMIHLQIKEGTLGAYGEVSDEEWKPIDYIVYDATKKVYTDLNLNREMTEGTDYEMLGPKLKKFDFDDVVTDEKGHVVTGIKLVKSTDHAIQIEIQTTKFNINSGKLQSANSYWLKARNRKRNVIDLYQPDKPTRTFAYDISQPGSTVHLVKSDNVKDAGLSTVPFLDSQPVEPKSEKLLSGAGLFLRNADGFGGFIGIRLIGLDLSKYINDIEF